MPYCDGHPSGLYRVPISYRGFVPTYFVLRVFSLRQQQEAYKKLGLPFLMPDSVCAHELPRGQLIAPSRTVKEKNQRARGYRSGKWTTV
jgi:hypothetical protein